MARGDSYNVGDITNPGAQVAIEKLKSDPEFKSRYFSDDPTIRNFALDQILIAQQNAAARSYYVPNETSANAAGEKIKNAYADPLFMERYQSNDPRVRGQAVDELSKLFFDKYGNRPNGDEPVQNTPRSNPSPAPASTPQPMQYTRSTTVARNSEAWKYQQGGQAYLSVVKVNGGKPFDF
jgi:hypothetical protein